MTSDGKYVVSGGGSTLSIWSVQYKRPEVILRGHTQLVNHIAITSDNKYIASASLDKTVRIWSLQGKTQVAVFMAILTLLLV